MKMKMKWRMIMKNNDNGSNEDIMKKMTKLMTIMTKQWK